MSSSQGPASKPPPSDDAHWEMPASPEDFQAYMAKYGSYVGGSDEAAPPAAGPATAPPPAGAAPAAGPAPPSPYADMFNERLEGENEYLAAENAAAEAARAQRGK
jgi:hypothetical protein